MSKGAYQLEDVRVRLMMPRDLDRVAEIAADVVGPPDTRDDIRRHLVRGGTVCLVLVARGRVAGFLIYRRLMADVQIHALVVASSERGRGYGRRLFDRVRRYVFEAPGGLRSAGLLTRETDLAAAKFLARMGCRCSLVRESFPDCDGYRWTLASEDA